MPDQDLLQIKNIVDITDQLKQKDRRRELIKRIRESIILFQDAYRERRTRLMEINAIYRNKSYMDKNKAGWQTKTFLPLSYNSIEKKTSMVHQALWGNRLTSPYTAVGMTPEDHNFAESAESLLNNTMTRIGFYGISEEAIRSTVKYGLGVYRYGWVRRKTDRLWREVIKNEKGEVARDANKRPQYKYVRKKFTTNQPYVRSVDIVDHIGWDPTAKTFDPWQCGYVYEIRSESKEEIYEQEVRGLYEKGSYDRLKFKDPHGLSDLFAFDPKEPQIRQDEGLQTQLLRPIQDRYDVVDWYGWFDVDGDGLREFIKASVILSAAEKDGVAQVLCAEENLLGEYPFVDVQYSRSLHSLTPWGVVDPVVEVQYAINEFFNQRGDSVKLKLHPQFLINVDKVYEDHSYVSFPGAFHPFQTGDEPVKNAMEVLQFQNLEYIGVNEEERLINLWTEVVGVADFQKVLNSSNKNTPATTIISILNEQQAGNSMIINGILDKHGVLGMRILRMIQLFGDEEFIIRTSGRRGLEFKQESLENILGEFDIKVTTSTFFGNKEIELQQLIQLRPFWENSQHIDLVEVDRAIVQNILPKLVEKIIKVPDEPIPFADEMTLFLYGQGEGVRLSPIEDLASLETKLKGYNDFKRTPAFKKLDDQTVKEVDLYLRRIEVRIEELKTEQQLKAAAAAKATAPLEGEGGPGGNIANAGSPNNRTIGNAIRPQPNNLQI